MDPQSGIFARGLWLEQGTKNACESVEKLAGVDMRQTAPYQGQYRLSWECQLAGAASGGERRRRLCRYRHLSTKL